MLNRIVLGLNLVALLVFVGERSNLNGGSLSWLLALPWASFAAETWALTAASTVSSEAIIASWLVITGLWLLATAGSWALERKDLGHRSSSKSTSDTSAATSLGRNEFQSARLDPGLGQNPLNDEATGSPTPSPVQTQTAAHGIADPALGSLFEDLSRQVGAFTPEARAELEKVEKALAALAQKDPGAKSS